MKPIQLTKSGIILLFILFIAGCAKDSSTDPATSDARSKFLGKWSVREPATKGQNYEVTITADPSSSDGVYIDKFANAASGISAFALIDGSTISLVKDEILSNEWKVNGSGILSGTKITWAYSLNTGADLQNITATYTKE